MRYDLAVRSRQVVPSPDGLVRVNGVQVVLRPSSGISALAVLPVLAYICILNRQSRGCLLRAVIALPLACHPDMSS